MKTIRGDVLECIERKIKDSDNVYYEFYASFGEGLIKETTGKPVSLGEHDFIICPRGRDDIRAKIRIVE